MSAKSHRHLDLIYVLSGYPSPTSTFVNGEIACVAPLVHSVSVYGMHTARGIQELRPGGIPQHVQIRWPPELNSLGFWRCNAAAAAKWGRRYARAFLAMAGRLAKPRAYLRAIYAFSQAAPLALGMKVGPETHIHAHFADRGGLGAYALAKLVGVPYTLTVHAYDIFLPNPHLGLLVRNSALTLAISEFARQAVLQKVPGVDPDRVRVIHVGVPTGALAALAESKPVRPEGAPAALISVGNLVTKKGMDVLLDAVALLLRDGRRLSCDIVGDGPLREELCRRAEELGLTGVVSFTGRLHPDDARGRIARADLFVLASRSAPNGDADGIPVVLMEAMACQTPVVSTRLSGIPELIADQRTGRLVEPDDPQALAEAIADQLDHRDRSTLWAADAQRVVAREFDQCTNAVRLLDAIADARRSLAASPS